MIDIGANLTNSRFINDYEDVLQRAGKAGLTAIVITGTDIKSSLQAAGLCQQHPNFLYSTCGCHPHDARDFNLSDVETFRTLLTQPGVKAIGECGLDFNRNYSSKTDQITAFTAQLELACETKKPLFLHQRDAHQLFLSILKTYRQDLGRIVVHCFTEGTDELFAYLEMDCYIGITGWLCDKKRGKALRQAVLEIPENRIMVETDAPFLLPQNLEKTSITLMPEGRRNEPAFLPFILKKLAELRQQEFQYLQKITEINSQKFFEIN